MSLLARISLRNRGLTALVAVLAIVFGAICVPQLKQQLFPSLDFPAAFIVATYQGASPDIVDQQVAAPITSAIQGIAGLKNTTSVSRESSATVSVEFEFGTNLDQAVTKVDTALNRIKAQLPQNVTPMVYAGSTSDIPVLVLAASGGGDERALVDRLKTIAIPEIQRISGVREATISGARDQTITITPDPAKLAVAGVDVTAIATVLRGNGVSTPAGAITEGDRALTVQVGNALTSVADIEGLYLTPATASGPATAASRGPVRLGDVAKVSQTLAAPTSITRTNGRASLGISVTASPDGNAVRVSDDIRAALPGIERSIGQGSQLTPIFDQAPYVKKSIRSLTDEGLLGLLFAALVILVFLFSVRSTLVTAVSMPLSIVIALIALWVGDYSLNILTLGALTIAIGRVVDDSIVVLENIKRHLGYGEDKHHAVTTAVKEVAGAVTASTVTTVAVFAPIALVGGMIGQLFSSFAITITVALVASLLVSLTLIPVLAFWFLKPATGGDDPSATRLRADERERASLLQRTYVPVIRFATRRRAITSAIGVVIFVATLGLATGLQTNFFDHSGQNTLTVSQTLPIGTSLNAADTAAAKVETALKDTAGIETYQVTVGGAGMMGMTSAANSNEANFSITLSESADATKVQDRLRTRLATLSDAGELKVSAGSGGGGFSADQLQVVVKATDPATLAKASEQVRAAMAATAGVADVSSDLAASMPRVEVRLDRQKAAALGLSDTTVGQTVSAVLRGMPLGQLTIDGSVQTILMRSGQTPASAAQVAALPLMTPTGPVPLGQIAKVTTVDGPVRVTRIDGERGATVTGTATGSDVGKTTKDLTTALKKLNLPDAASYTIGGVSADQSGAFADLGMALLAAIAIVYIVMAVTFRSLVQPLILLVSIPFAATGAIVALLVTGTALGVPALIGALMLVGVVVTNAIVLMDLINKYRASGMPAVEAVIEGGRHRLRPILMTATATICALVPMALGAEGSGGFISQPLAVVVIGGLVSSTVLTLVLVPTLYTMVAVRSERRAPRTAERSPDLVGATV